ncbi:hypothetical protein RN001_004770 [Aquatica leii]|uniref:Choline/carnitine acyltransferase domain-containing protein n=1 Tax=Aquatica leii TaxID=1421715 RepID=A0AAN7PIV7_9COLE|nr:hypothetical protein RN001_004770 [Aquatica leii]
MTAAFRDITPDILNNVDNMRIRKCLEYNGWKESLLSLPKKWLSGTPLVHSNLKSDSDTNVVLPKLPVPQLEQTLMKYEKTMRPLLDETGRERLKNIIEKFGRPDGIGPRLQLYLLDRQQKLDNWVSSSFC